MIFSTPWQNEFFPFYCLVIYQDKARETIEGNTQFHMGIYTYGKAAFVTKTRQAGHRFMGWNIDQTRIYLLLITFFI